MTQIKCVIKEDDVTDRETGRAHPPQCAIRINDGRFESVTRPFNHNVVVAQKGAVRPGLKLGRIVVAAALIVESSGRDRGDALLRRSIQKAISQGNSIRISSVK